ncbi:hypothetical protein IEQ34_015889 [Dendrobium chrysotoxum]|uniref:GTD-binding domain-containing protein n=1 Tax=Dendrobium chrysotoxum TaxID=161865 RepID=A0AAV7GIV7_DENCH|nr:hypothetical protein IEQ34_015889 [Dendrobium chrysotoxum]
MFPKEKSELCLLGRLAVAGHLRWRKREPISNLGNPILNAARIWGAWSLSFLWSLIWPSHIMAASPNKQKGGPSQFLTALSSAFSEWILIILLLIDAFFLFFASKIFRSCKLQTPCLLCSRFGYLLGDEKLGFYRDLVCDTHKLEISSLTFCHVHKKLVDAREMCENCLLSFAKKNSTLETYKFFLRKLNMDLDDGNRIFNSCSDKIVKVPLLHKDHDAGSPLTRPCSCCSQHSRNKPYAYRESKNKPIFNKFDYHGSPLPSAKLRARAHLEDGLNKAKEVLSVRLADYKPGGQSFDLFSHFKYRELKSTSEPESEVPLSDEDDRTSMPRGTEDVKEKCFERSLKSSSSITNTPETCLISDDIVLEKLVHPDPVISVVSASVLKSQHDEDGSCDKSFVESNVDSDHGLKEISWTHFEGRPILPTSSQIVTKSVPTVISKVKDLSEVDVLRTSCTSHVEINEPTELTNITSKADRVMIDSDQSLATDAKGAQPSPTSEIALTRESARIHENLKQRLSQVLSPRWLQSPRNDIIHGARKDNECKLSHTLSFNGLPSINKKPDAELSCSEFADGSFVSEIEGEVSVERLRKQIKIDQQSLSILYKELEEERNASAIAANQAMAMINKLQEEKAAMQLEVMQYLRMMEEQTQYEQEALRNLNDQLTEREKEIQDLEAELESCRKLPGDESMAEKVLQPLFDSDESEYSTTSTPHVVRPRRKRKHHLPSVMFEDSAWPPSSPIKENLLDFEDEREYIAECLKRLEKNVRLFSCADASRLVEEDDEFDDDIYADDTKWPNLELQEGAAEDEGNKHNLYSQNIIEGNSGTPEINQMKEMIASEKHQSPHIKSLSHEENCIYPTQEAEYPVGEHENYNSLNSACTKKMKSKTGKRNGGVALSDEIEHLNARLEALEADRDFLDRTINSLRYGKDGLQFVQEIATHLRELRKIGLTQRKSVFA